MSGLWHVLAEPWGSALDRRAVLELVLLGVAGGALGCWVVFADLSYAAESMAHALLPGLVLAALVDVPLVIGGGVGMLVAALGVAVVGQLPGIDRDTAVAVVVTPLLGLGALMALSPDTPAGLGGLLFGDVLGVSDGDLAAAAALCVVLLLSLAVGHGRLLLVGFDRAGARALGTSVTRVDLALLTMMAATLLVAVQALGNLLVVAVLVGPAAAARPLARRMPAMMAASATIAAAAGVGGLYLSYYAATATGATVTGLLVAAAVGTQLLRPRRRRRSPAT